MPTIAETSAEGELGARPRGRRRRRQSAIFEPVSRHSRSLQQGFHRRLECRARQSCSCVRCSPTSRNISRLSAAAAPTSPIGRFSNPMRDETALTRDRASDAAGQRRGEIKAKTDALQAAQTPSARRSAARRIDLGAEIAAQGGRSARRGPGASIEAISSRSKSSSTATPGSRPMDALLANLNELYRAADLAGEQSGASQAGARQVEVEVASLRANVSRLPQPLAGMMDKVANDAAGDASTPPRSRSSRTRWRRTSPRRASRSSTTAIPFSKSDRDVPLADFARLFAPNGVIDRFFAANLAPLVNLTGEDLDLAAQSDTRRASCRTRRCAQFQQAAEIRDAFFPTGGSLPNVSFEVKPLTLSGERADARRCSSTAPSVVAQQGATAARPCNGPAAAPAPPRSRWRPTCRTRNRRSSARAPGRCSGSSTPAPITPHGNVDQRQLHRRRTRSLLQFTSASLNNPLSMPSLASIQVSQRIVRPDARGTFRQAAGQTRFHRRPARRADSSRSGSPGCRRAWRPRARSLGAAGARPTIARRSGASGSAPILRRGDRSAPSWPRSTASDVRFR